MLPENLVPNAMGLSPQGSANMVGAMGDTAASAYQGIEPPAPANPDLNAMLQKVSSSWKQLEEINGQFGGDTDKFRLIQKSIEDWIATLKLPEGESPAPSALTY